MIALVGAAIALAGVLTGLAWRFPAFERLDWRLFAGINRGQYPLFVDGLLRLLRPLGTSWGLLAGVVGILALRGWKSALLLSAVTAFSGAIERGLKLLVRRRRPFETHMGVRLRVPPPTDPSFPSGDASRAWFLGSAFAFGFSLPLLASILVLLPAGLAGLGRVRGGAHYPSDVWAGSWLGLGMGLVWVMLSAIVSPS